MRTSRPQRRLSRPSDSDAIDEIIALQQLCGSEATRYTAEMLAFDNENETYMASQFREDVLSKIENAEYQSALIGLDKFIDDYLAQDPLMRMDFGGLSGVMRPALVVLVTAQANGIDTAE